jgi:hypothetical protein
MITISTRRHRRNIYFLLPLLLLALLLVAARTMSDTIAVAVRWVRTMMTMPCSEEEDGGGIGPEEARRRTEKPRMGDADGEESYGPNIRIICPCAIIMHAAHTTSCSIFWWWVVGGEISPRQTGSLRSSSMFIYENTRDNIIMPIRRLSKLHPCPSKKRTDSVFLLFH